jgi:hypothetical protein
MPKQFGKGLSLGYAIGIPRHIRSLRMLDCERGWEVSVSGMDMAEFKLTNCKLQRMLVPRVNDWQQAYGAR